MAQESCHEFVPGFWSDLCPVIICARLLCDLSFKTMTKKMFKKTKIILTLEEIDALDDLLDLYLNGEFNERGINRDALLQIQEQVGEIMELINARLGFTDQRVEKDIGKYLM